MIILVYILIGYLASAALSYSVVKWGIKTNDDINPTPFSDEFITQLSALVPLINLWISFLFIKLEFEKRLKKWLIIRAFKSIRRKTKDPIVKETMTTLIENAKNTKF